MEIRELHGHGMDHQLHGSTEPSMGKTYLFLPTAKDIWEAVCDTYLDLENSSQIFELKTKLWNSKQGERSVIDYYNEMKTLWLELDLCYDDAWECKLDLCYDDAWECKNDSVKYQKRMENDRVYVFLAGINRELDEVRGRILGRKECKNDNVKYQKCMENDGVYVFLAGLNRELDEVWGRILGRNPLPSLSEVFSERREEGRRRVMMSD